MADKTVIVVTKLMNSRRITLFWQVRCILWIAIEIYTKPGKNQDECSQIYDLTNRDVYLWLRERIASGVTH